jgi:SAM-dependent methyltransferase
MTEHQHHSDTTAAPDDDVVFDAAFWDDRYGSASQIWSGNPNPQLVAETAELTPSTALDIGSGEGADAVWLARRGWQVTAVDISQVALDRAAEHARSVGEEVADRITWVQADLTADPAPDLGSGFGLVSAQFMHLAAPQRDAVFRGLAASVGPGGIFLVVGHDVSDLQTAPHMRPHHPELMFTTDDIVAMLDLAEWTIVAAESRPRSVLDPDGQPVHVADAVVVARRR